MKILIISAFVSFFNYSSISEDACTATISNGTQSVSCTASTCSAAKACAIAGWQAMQ
jgi:hypothetical protein